MEGHSLVFDTVYIMLLSYHLVEWVRMAMLVITVVMGDIMFVRIYYWTSLNTLFGLAAYIYVHIVRFSPEGRACGDIQYYRG